MRNGKKRKVLIIDGEANLRLLYGANFKMSGYKVSLAATGAEAVVSAKTEKPDLVILDLKLPDNDGFDTMAALLHEDQHLPVIINTGYAHFRADIRSWAADAFMIKSSNVDELMTTASELLHRQQAVGIAR